jgi:CBS domain-containing protein
MMASVTAGPASAISSSCLGSSGMRSSGLPALPVVDAGGSLVGMLTLDNITDLLLVQRARG